MSLLTTRLGIKKPQDSDNFLTSDFDANYDLIDSYPGVFVCTSATKPSWGAAQAGQLIVCTDIKALLEWTGSAWIDLLALPASWMLSSTLNTSQTGASFPVNSAAVSSYTVGTLTSSRACNAVWNAALDVTPLDGQKAYSVAYTVSVNGSLAVTKGGTFSQSVIGVIPSSYTSFSDATGAYTEVMAFGTAPLQAGTNTISIQVSTISADTWSGSSFTPVPVHLVNFAIGFIATDNTNT